MGCIDFLVLSGDVGRMLSALVLEICKASSRCTGNKEEMRTWGGLCGNNTGRERIMQRKRILFLRIVSLIAIVLIALGISGCDRKPKVGSEFSFGEYGGYHTVWQVLDIEDNMALIITKYAIDIRDYNEGGGEVTWTDCSLRQWLNDDFLHSSFSDAEREAIQETTLVDTGTKDYIFLLSSLEVNQYFTSNEDRITTLNMTKEAERAYAQRVSSDKTYELGYDRALSFIQDLDEEDYWPVSWWLRSSGKGEDSAPAVGRTDGSIFDQSIYGFPPFAPVTGVRPAMWVDLESVDR